MKVTQVAAYFPRVHHRRILQCFVLIPLVLMTLTFALSYFRKPSKSFMQRVLHVHMSEENFVGKVLHGIDLSRQRQAIEAEQAKESEERERQEKIELERKAEEEEEEEEEEEVEKEGEEKEEKGGRDKDSQKTEKNEKELKQKTAQGGGHEERKNSGKSSEKKSEKVKGQTSSKENVPKATKDKSKTNETKDSEKRQHIAESYVYPLKSLHDVNDSQTPRNWDLRRLGQFPLRPEFKNPCWYEPSRPPVHCNRGPLRPIRPSKSSVRLRCLPYFFFVGMPKAGTTDIYERLVRHPEVATPKWKEPFWIQRHRFDPQCSSLAAYLDFYDTAAQEIQKHATGRYYKMVTVDAGVDTMWDNYYWRELPGNENCTEPRLTNADYVRMLNPRARIIVSLREPSERVFSDYMYEYTMLDYEPDPHDFHKRVVEAIYRYRQCLTARPPRFCLYHGALENALSVVRIRIGLYAQFLEDWLKVFRREQVHVLRFEDYVRNPKEELLKIFQFLDLRPLTDVEIKAILAKRVSNKRRIKQTMLPETRTILQEFYSPFNAQLARLMGDARYLWMDNSTVVSTGDNNNTRTAIEKAKRVL